MGGSVHSRTLELIGDKEATAISNDDDDDKFSLYHASLPLDESPLANWIDYVRAKCLNLNKYTVCYENNTNLLRGITKRVEITRMVDGCGLGILNSNNFLSEKIILVKPIGNDFMVLKEDSNNVLAEYQANCDLIMSTIQDPTDTLLYSYYALVYEDYVRLKVVSNKEYIFEQLSWRVFGFTIPFMFWKKIYERQFLEKSLIRIFIRGIWNKKINDNRWEYDSILYIKEVEQL